MLSDAPAGGFVKHLSTWLNEHGHQQEWLPSRRRVNGRLATQTGRWPM
jgi:hypothetical protein